MTGKNNNNKVMFIRCCNVLNTSYSFKTFYNINQNYLKLSYFCSDSKYFVKIKSYEPIKHVLLVEPFASRGYEPIQGIKVHNTYFCCELKRD